MNGWGMEARVGAFVLAALAILIAFVLALGDVSLKPGVTMNADFAFTSGLQDGAPVMMSGIRIGRVGSLEILGSQPSPPAATAQSRLGQRDTPLVRADLEVEAERVTLFKEDTQLHIGTQ